MTAMSNINNATNERPRKDERVAVRLPANVKLTLERAAEMTGRSLSDFVVGSALSAAQRTLAENERMRLAEQDRVVFMAALSNPPKPNDALKAAAARYRQLTK